MTAAGVGRVAGVAPAAAITIGAVLASGAAAGVVVSPLLSLTTVALSVLLWRAARRAPADRAPDTSVTAGLPPAVGAPVTAALEQLSEGEARRLLLSVVAQAKALYAKTLTTFDEAREQATRENVNGLVVACCSTALELARLDAVQSERARRIDRPAAITRPSGEVDARLVAARDAMVKRLFDAASALTALYAADLVQDAAAGERVADLASEIAADAAARKAAVDEIAASLGES